VERRIDRERIGITCLPITPIQAMEAVEVITLPSLEVSQEDVESRNRRINMHRFMHGHHPQDERLYNVSTNCYTTICCEKISIEPVYHHIARFRQR